MLQASDFVGKLKCDARVLARSLALPESQDPRVLAAAWQLLQAQAVSFIQFFGEPAQILDLAAKNGIFLEDFAARLRWSQTSDAKLAKDTLAHCQHRAKLRGKELSPQDLQSIANSPLDQAAYLLARAEVDAVVAGSICSTAEVIRAALRGVGLAADCKTISGSFTMIRESADSPPLHYLFGDCAVIIDPSSEQLVDIASATVASFQALFPEEEPVVAFLSFSTRGSAKHPRQQKVADAAKLFVQKFPMLRSDGELQFDAAVNSAVSQRKAPDSKVAGQANCFIFPDLDSGNIAYKITQRLGGFAAYGPLLQGLAKPFSDLSRGATADDITVAGLMALLRAKPQ